MKQNICTMLWVAALIFMSNSISGQEAKTLDLSQEREYRETVDSGTKLRFIIKNKIPTAEYRIVVLKKNRVPDVLELPEGMDKIKADTASYVVPCPTTLEDAKQIWSSIKTEENVPNAVRESKNILKELEPTQDDACRTTIQYLNQQISQTTEELETIFTVEASQAVEVSIFRKSDNSSEEVWKFIYEAPMAGQWVTTYGFSFVAPIFDEPERYFSQSKDSGFIVAQEDIKNRPQFIPSIFFTWIPNKVGWNGFNLSGTGGLGFDFEAPTVFLGGSLIYHYNISLNIGIVAHQQEFLRGKYSNGQAIGENLSSDQLHEKLYTVNPFVSLSFRLGKSPFASNNVQADSGGDN